MPGIFVRRAPEKRMLRNSENDAAAAACREEALLQDPAVVLDMLQHVETADHVEFVAERDVRGVHLQQAAAPQPARRAFKARDLRLAAERSRGRKRGFHRSEHAGGAAADLEEAAQARKIAAQRPDDETVACAEPVVAILQRRKTGKALAGKDTCRAEKVRRQDQQGPLRPGTIAAALARPGGRHRTQARGADLHPWLPTATPATISRMPSTLAQDSGSPNSTALRSSTSTNDRLTNG